MHSSTQNSIISDRVAKWLRSWTRNPRAFQGLIPIIGTFVFKLLHFDWFILWMKRETKVHWRTTPWASNNVLYVMITGVKSAWIHKQNIFIIAHVSIHHFASTLSRTSHSIPTNQKSLEIDRKRMQISFSLWDAQGIIVLQAPVCCVGGLFVSAILIRR